MKKEEKSVFVEQIGNIRVFIKQNDEKDITVILMNGADVLSSEVYYTFDKKVAIENLLEKELDIYSEKFLCSMNIKKHSNNTYEISNNCKPSDWFCRIDNTKYFKHYYKYSHEFIKDKNGKRIIDR